LTDSRPEITARADGAFVVLCLTEGDEITCIPMSVDEADALEGQLCIARFRARGEELKPGIPGMIALATEVLGRMTPMIATAQVIEEINAKSWRDRAIEEPML
jgi:hypothetical protein